MKYLVLLTFLFLSFSVLATKIPSKTINTLNYKNLPCKQKILPLKVDYDIRSGQAFIKFIAEGDLEDFTIISIRGIDGLKVNNIKASFVSNLLKGEAIDLEVNFFKPEGLVYLVADVKAKVNGVTRRQPVTIPVGEISTDQKTERKKHIRSLPASIKKPSGSALQGNKEEKDKKEEKFHMMKLE